MLLLFAYTYGPHDLFQLFQFKQNCEKSFVLIDMKLHAQSQSNKIADKKFSVCIH